MHRNFTATLFVFAAVFALGQQAKASGTETYVGIGITISKSHDSFQIVDLVPNAPAAEGGVSVNDWLVDVDQKPTAKLKLDQVVKMLSGDAGTTVVLSLQDDKTHAARDVKLVRSEITIQCFLEGNINLNYAGTPQTGTLSGFVGQDSLFLNAFGNQVSGNVNGEFVNLTLQDQPGFGLTITGWIHSIYITWRSTGNMFTGYQECIE